MAERQGIVVVTPGERTPGPATPGMERQQAVATEGMWSGWSAPTPAWCRAGTTTATTRR
jgi:hypothetical protein